MTIIAKTRYYQGRVAYPISEQLRAARATWDFDDVRRPTEDVDCTHIQRIEISGRDAQEARLIEKETLERFFDYIGHRSGFRVLTHETTTGSHQGAVTAIHEIVYVIELRPTKGYVKLTLKSELPPERPAGLVSGVFSDQNLDQMSRLFEQPKRD